MRGFVTISFDDGLSSVYTLAFPEMERIGATGTVFVISDLIGSRYSGYPVMTKQMLKSLSSKGWEIGSHTRTHQNLALLSGTELMAELMESKTTLQRLLGCNISSLAYPFGACDAKVRALASKYYKFARTVSCYPPLRTNRIPPTDRLQLSAISAYDRPLSLPIHLINDFLYSRIAGLGPQRRSGVTSSIGLPSNRHVVEARFVRKWVRNLRANQWLVLCFHDISIEKKSSTYSICVNQFREIMKAVSNGSTIINIGDANTTSSFQT
jgi:peptidoglycan/xylan/chitin deacetylase (PgdA/CDA1 family)